VDVDLLLGIGIAIWMDGRAGAPGIFKSWGAGLPPVDGAGGIGGARPVPGRGLLLSLRIEEGEVSGRLNGGRGDGDRP